MLLFQVCNFKLQLKNLTYKNDKLCHFITCSRQNWIFPIESCKVILRLYFLHLSTMQSAMVNTDHLLGISCTSIETERVAPQGQTYIAYSTWSQLNLLELWSSWQALIGLNLKNLSDWKFTKKKKQYIRVLFSKLSLLL